MDATGPRTIRPAENSTLEQTGAQGNRPGSENIAETPGNEAQDGNTSRASHAPSPIDRMASQEGEHAQRRAADPPDGAAAAGQTSTGNQANVPTVTANKHEQFREIVGKGGYEDLNSKIRKAHEWHTYQYWFVAMTSNSLLFLQVLIAASLTVLGAFNNRRARTATIFLGATNTVIAGLLTYFKSRNQPNRARQLRNDLGKVVDQLDDAEANFRTAGATGDVAVVVQDIRTSYRQARADAEANYPDLWVKAGDVRNPAPPDLKDKPSALTPPAPGQVSQAQRTPGPDAFASGALNEPQISNNARAGQQNTG